MQRGRNKIRERIVEFPGLVDLLESALQKHLLEPPLNLDSVRDLSFALIALLPSSHDAVTRMLSARSPHGIYEAHFSMFVALDREALDPLQRDGIEFLLGDYLRNVRSAAAYAAWKAGLVLGFEWHSPRTERLLVDLIAHARFPAGRLGAINGYQWLVEHRKTFLPVELTPLHKAARSDPSEKVRSLARFHLNQMKRQMPVQSDQT
jgi:hypothetical protein